MTLSQLFGCARASDHDEQVKKSRGSSDGTLRSGTDIESSENSHLRRLESLPFEASESSSQSWQRRGSAASYSFPRPTLEYNLRRMEAGSATLPRRTIREKQLANSLPYLRVPTDLLVTESKSEVPLKANRGKSPFRTSLRKSNSLFRAASVRIRRSFGRSGHQRSSEIVISLPQLVQLRFGSKLVSHEKYRQLKVFSRELNAAQEVPASPLRRQDICAICQLPVFIAERLKVGAKVLHRTCFRCARCKAQLTPASSYETENGEYCCEVCPDEEKSYESSLQSLGANTESNESKGPVSIESHVAVEEKVESAADVEKREKQKPVERFPSSVQSLISRFDSAAARSAFFAKELQSLGEPPEKPPRSPVVEEAPSGNAELSTPFEEEIEEPESNVEVVVSPADDESEAVPVDGDSGDAEQFSASVCDECVNDIVVVVSDEVCDAVNKLHSEDDDLSAQKLEEITPSDDPPLAISESEAVSPNHAENGSAEIAAVLPIASPRRRGKLKQKNVEYPEDLNPFEDEVEETSAPVVEDQKNDELKNDKSASYNPFEEEDLDETNPFATEEDDVVKSPKSPVPTPRKSLMSTSQSEQFVRSPSPTLSMRSSVTMTPITKKRLAPSQPGSQTQSRPVSPASTIGRYRKDRRAPLPPTLTPKDTQSATDVEKIEKCPLPDLVSMNNPQRRDSSDPDVVSDESCRKSDDIFRKSGDGKLSEEPDDIKDVRICHKNEKDKMNENRKSSSDSRKYEVPSKDTYGQWKRKKGPAPPRPLPQKRQLRKLPMRQIQQELNDLEIQQSEMERQGVALERQIRAITESSPDVSDDNSAQSLKLEAEDLILQLFDIVNEKNELLRRQTELMYLKRQQRLEEEYVELEYQIRCLLEKSENNRTEEDRKREEELIQRLVLVVERRAEIVDCLELERRRGEEEDTSIKCHLEAYNLKHEPTSSTSPDPPESKSSKSKFKSPAKLLMKVSEHKKKTKNEGEPASEKKTKQKWFKK